MDNLDEACRSYMARRNNTMKSNRKVLETPANAEKGIDGFLISLFDECLNDVLAILASKEDLRLLQDIIEKQKDRISNLVARIEVLEG